MRNPIHERYLTNEIMTADPLKLVCILYRAAIELTAAARLDLRAGAIRARSRHISRVHAILTELSQSLDPSHPAVSRPLADLYGYMQRRLIEANSKQIEPPLEEVEKLLITLLEGWQAASATASHIAAPPSEYEPVSCSY